MAKNKLNVRSWETTVAEFQFPEVDPQDKLHYQALVGRPNSGVCISGGGTVSASLIAGYFKALDDLGLMEQIRYISGVSGGAWGSIPFAYLPEDRDDGEFYASIGLPQDLTEDKIQSVPEGSMTYAVTNADIVKDTIKNADYGHAAYERAVGEIFLHPFGIKSPTEAIASRRQFFVTDESAMNDIIGRNPELKPADFILLKKNRPYPIMNTTMLVHDPQGKTKKQERNYDIFHFEFTPLYAGMLPAHKNAQADQALGGSYVETIGFNPDQVSVNDGQIITAAEYRFELCLPVGTSGSAIEEMILEKLPVAARLLPKFNYWNPSQGLQEAGAEQISVESYFYGDGGIIEDTGVVSLLLRKVTNVAMLLTEPVYFEGDTDDMAYRVFGYNQIAMLFGADLLSLVDVGGEKVLKRNPDKYNRQVFDNSAGQFEQLLQNLKAARDNGKAEIVSDTFQVVDNELFGVKGGWDCQVIWSVVDTCTDYQGLLPADIQDQIGKAGSQLQNFPQIKVFEENAGHVIQLTAKQANMLGSQAYWMLMDRADTFKQILGPRTEG